MSQDLRNRGWAEHQNPDCPPLQSETAVTSSADTITPRPFTSNPELKAGQAVESAPYTLPHPVPDITTTAAADSAAAVAAAAAADTVGTASASASADVPAQAAEVTVKVEASVAVESESKQRVLAQDDSVGPGEQIALVTVVILSMLTAFGPICTDIYLPAVPIITHELNADASVIQLSLTACFLGLALGQLLAGPVSDAFGRKRPLYFSLLVFIVSSLGCALAQNVTQLIVARLFQGLAGAGGIVLSRSIACDMYSGARLTQFMALLMTINSLAPILGPIAGSAIVAVADWPMLFLALVGWGVVLLLACWVKLPESLPADRRIPKLSGALKDMGSQLLNRRFLCLALSMSFIMGSFFGYLSSSPFIFQSIFGLSPVGYSIVFGINALLISLSSVLAGRLARVLSERTIVVLSLMVQFAASVALALVLLFSLENIYIVAIILALFVAMVGSSQTAGFGLVMSARSGGAGSASGIFGVLTFLFGALTSPLVGLMGEHSMLPQLLVMLFCTIGAYVLLQVGLHLPPNSSGQEHNSAAAAAAAPDAADSVSLASSALAADSSRQTAGKAASVDGMAAS